MQKHPVKFKIIDTHSVVVLTSQAVGGKIAKQTVKEAAKSTSVMCRDRIKGMPFKNSWAEAQ